MVRTAWLAAATFMVAACVAGQPYTYQPRGGGPERRLPTVEARVVTARAAEQSGLTGRAHVIGFAGGRDGTELIAQFFADADAAGAELISELAIVIQTSEDGRRVECRTEIVPETVTESQLRPGYFAPVEVRRPVQRTVTEQEYRCKPVTRSELRPHTEYEQKCGSVTRPVTRTRTVYRSEYDYASRTTRTVPRTETYTDYQHAYECKSEPVTRSRSELVTKTECGLEAVTHTVTRYEYQYENEYVPPRMETLERRRLRELDPVCYELAPAPATGPTGATVGNRIEGRIFVRR